MSNINTKKIIAIALTGLFCFGGIYGMITKTATLSDITPIVIGVISYYFGKGNNEESISKSSTTSTSTINTNNKATI